MALAFISPLPTLLNPEPEPAFASLPFPLTEVTDVLHPPPPPAMKKVTDLEAPISFYF